MQVGAHVWNGDKCGVVLASDETGGVTVGYFAEVETLTSDSENPSPLSSSPATDEETAEPTAADEPVKSEPPAPAEKPDATSAGTDPLAALTEDERATYTRLQGKLDSASSGA